MAGFFAREIAPRIVRAANHTNMTGPNRRPILAVPRLWNANKVMRMTRVSGTTKGAKALLSTSRPSTADSTVMAGVSMPSP